MDHGSFSTRKIGTKITVHLTKSAEGGFGIKIAERDNLVGSNRPIYITAICTTGSAYRDGRLKEGDRLLEINSIDLYGKSQPEVTRMLKSVPVGQTLEFVVSRQNADQSLYSNSSSSSNNNTISNNNNTSSIITQEFSSNENSEAKQPPDTGSDINLSLIDLDPPDSAQVANEGDASNNNICEKNAATNIQIDGPGTHEYDIPLNDTKSAGLGLYLKFPGRKDKDRGIFVERVMVGGAAWKDGRLQSNDQLLAINGINLMGLSNAVAFDTLRAAVSRATTNTIRLKIIRRDPAVVETLLHGSYNTIESSDLKTIVKQQSTDTAPSIQSCDDESIDGEDRFKRDNFARQSISEKRHAQLMARASDKSTHKKSNSLESIQTQDHIRESVVIPPRAGTLRIARNRKVNESFRAAVDRSYEDGRMQSSAKPEQINRDCSTSNERSVDVSNYAYSMGYSTTSTNNDEKVLIRNNDDKLMTRDNDIHKVMNRVNHNNNHISSIHNDSNSITNLDNNHHGGGSNNNNTNNVISKEKKSSLLSKFFGSMKKLKKKTRDDEPLKSSAKTKSNNREPELCRSQSSKSSHSRFQSTQAPPSSVPPNHQFQYHQTNPNGLSNYNQNPKPVQLSNRASLPVHHQQYQNLAHHIHQPQMTYSKVAYNMIPEPKPISNGHHYSNSYIPHHVQQVPHHQIPVEVHHPQHIAYQTAPRVMPSHLLNGSLTYNQWQTPQHVGLPHPDGLWVTNSVDDNLRLHKVYGTHTQNIAQMHNQRSAMAQYPSPFVPTINGHITNQASNKMIHQSPILPGNTATLPHHPHHDSHLANPPPPRIIYYDF